MEQNTISSVLHVIAEHIINQENWMLGDSFNELLTNINDDQHKHLITIDNVFAVRRIDNNQLVILYQFTYTTISKFNRKIYCRKSLQTGITHR